MIAESIASVLANDWSAIASPIEIEGELQRLGILVRRLHRHAGPAGGFMQLWLLAGRDKQAHEALLLEYTRGPFMTEAHGYPQNGCAYGQRVWVLRGEVTFISSITPENPCPMRTVRAGESCSHLGSASEEWCHRTLVQNELLALIHQPHGSRLHPALRALSARLPKG